MRETVLPVADQLVELCQLIESADTTVSAGSKPGRITFGYDSLGVIRFE